jgi:hypothetical protein
MFAVAWLTAAGCKSDTLVNVIAGSQTISAHVGQEIAITLGNVGPGTYGSPPEMSSDVLTYIGVEVVPPFTPAGPTQRFRFTAAMPGRTIVVFRRSLNDQTLAVVTDTVDVR